MVIEKLPPLKKGSTESPENPFLHLLRRSGAQPHGKATPAAAPLTRMRVADAELFETIESRRSAAEILASIQCGADVDAKRPGDGQTPIMRAIYVYLESGIDIFDTLKRRRADLDERDNDRNTLAMHTALTGSLECCQWVYNNRTPKFDVNAVNRHGATLLDLVREELAAMRTGDHTDSQGQQDLQRMEAVERFWISVGAKTAAELGIPPRK